MMVELFPNIPRIYTGLAESLACLIFILPLVKREKWLLTFIIASFGQLILQIIVGSWPLTFWILGIILNVLWMFFVLLVTTKITLKQALYTLTKAFIIAEFIASFAWQLYCHLIWLPTKNEALTIPFMTISYLILFVFFFLLERKLGNSHLLKNIQAKNVMIGILTAIIIFSISNIGFLFSPSSLLMGDSFTIFLTRTLINLSGICILYMQEKQNSEVYLKRELTAINNIFQGQYEQYVAYKESNSIINRTFHDLKHQIEMIRTEKNTEIREEYLTYMNQIITDFSVNIETGNAILNTILTQKNQFCLENDISFSCIVDGELVNYLETLDICSLFGNALDNAIESVIKITDIEKRLINLRVFKRGNFVMITVENYTTTDLLYEDGLPITTKSDKNYHGYGIKSMAYIAEKYQGDLTLDLTDNWFSLKILLPLTLQVNKKRGPKA